MEKLNKDICILISSKLNDKDLLSLAFINKNFKQECDKRMKGKDCFYEYDSDLKFQKVKCYKQIKKSCSNCGNYVCKDHLDYDEKMCIDCYFFWND